MKRREFITLLGGAATWPLAARAQQVAGPVIGFLHVANADDWGAEISAFRNGLRQAGYIEGRNLRIEYRWAEGQRDRLPGMTRELIAQSVNLIVASPSSAASAAKAVTDTIPIVFVSSFDPIRLGFAKSLQMPGGNMTGVSLLTGELEVKLLDLAREIAPDARVVGTLVNPNNGNARRDTEDLGLTARRLGLELLVANARSKPELLAAFENLAQKVSALVVGSDVTLFRERELIVALAAHHRLPAIYYRQEWAQAGGLLSYGADISDAYRVAADYAVHILKGKNVGDLPIAQATKIKLVVNLKTAASLGLELPTAILIRADEVIE